GFALLSIVVYVCALMSSHLSAFRIAGNIRKALMDHIAKLPLGFIGEMGSGNTSASSMWMHAFAGTPLPQCVGAGAGLDRSGIDHKLNVLTRAWKNYSGDGSVSDLMAWFGGYEMAMAVGGMLRAAERGMVIIVDGFIMTSCMLAASRLYPEVTEYAVYGHQGDESGHRLALEALGAMPLLHLDLRLGEGSGAVCAYPILQSAVRMINEMDSFADVNVTKYFD
uniref:nicotinate-nucleotide--dimethylbenzimidazole phosphoribosyltransferase n=1 Tax=Paramuribaculum intestinale TaxID=2094151 RepID=UPI0025B62BCC